MEPTTSPLAPLPPPARSDPLFASVTQREVTVGGLVGTTFDVWWRNAFKFAGLALLVLLPVFVVGVVAALVAAWADFQRTAGRMWAPFLPVILMMLTMLVFTGSLTYGAVQHLAERPVRFGEMLAVGFRRALPVLAAGLVSYVLMLAGTVLLVIPGIIVACALSVVIPAVVVERRGPFEAIKRSWELTRGYRPAIFASWLVMWLVLLVINAALQIGVTLLGPLAAVIALPAQAFVMALPMLMPAVAYHDLRTTKEGTPSEELARVFE